MFRVKYLGVCVYFKMYRDASVDKKKKKLGFAKDFEDSVYKCQGKCHIYRKKKRHYKIQLWKILLYIKMI